MKRWQVGTMGVLALGASSALWIAAAAPGTSTKGSIEGHDERGVTKQKLTFQGQKIKFTVLHRDVYRNGQRIFRKGDMQLSGSLGHPATLIQQDSSVSAQKILLSPANHVIYASMGFNKQVKVSGTLTPRSGRFSIRVEVFCEVAKLQKGVWMVEGEVNGFYEDTSGRHPLQGDIVTLSAFDNAVSIVQDGDVSLSSSAVQATP